MLQVTHLGGMAIKFNLNEHVFFWMVKCLCILIRHSDGVREKCDIVQSIVQEILWENGIYASIWEKLHKKMFCMDCSNTSLCKVLHRKVALTLYDLCLYTCWNKLDFFQQYLKARLNKRTFVVNTRKFVSDFSRICNKEIDWNKRKNYCRHMWY